MSENLPSLPSVHLKEFEPVSKDVLSLLPTGLIKKQMIVPIKKQEGRLIAAVPKTDGVVKPEGLALITGCPVDLVLAPVDEIIEFIKVHYSGEERRRVI